MAFSPRHRAGLCAGVRNLHGLRRSDELRSRPGASGLGTSFSGDDAERKTIAEYAEAPFARLAFGVESGDADAKSGARPLEQKGRGGVLATAGNLVFQGTIGTTFAAYRADTGAKVWEMPVQHVPIFGADHLHGRRRAIYRGQRRAGAGGLAHVERAAYSQLFLGKPRLLVFKLGGKAKLPPMPPESVGGARSCRRRPR